MGTRPLGGADPADARERSVESTTSFLLWDEEVRLLIDLGTGVGASLEVARHLAQRNPDAASFLALTHYHEDHWCGLRWRCPFAEGDLPATSYSPLFADGFSREAADAGDDPLRRLIAGLDEPGLWATPVLEPSVRIEPGTFEPGETLKLGSWIVRTCLLPHPGGCVGYRIEMHDGPVVAIATDCELDRAGNRKYENRCLDEFFDGVDLLILDLQYLDEEYDGAAPLGVAARDRRGWGHNSPRLVAASLHRLRRLPRVILLTHHDPERTIFDLHGEAISRQLRQRLSDLWRDASRADSTTIASLFDGDLWSLNTSAAPQRVERNAAADDRVPGP